MNRTSLIFALMGILAAGPAAAQMFEGLDLSDEKPKPRRKAPPKEEKPAVETEGLGLDLTADPPPAAAKPKAAPAMSFEAVDVSGKSADRQRLEVAIAQFRADKFEQAALTAFELMEDPKFAGLADEAHFVLARALYRMGMYHSSLAEFSRLLARGPDGGQFSKSLEWLFFISHKTTNETVILDEIARYANFEFPERYRNEFRYLLARYHFIRGRALDRAGREAEAAVSFEEVRTLAKMIPRTDPFYPRAKYLEGLSDFRNGRFQQSVDSMKEVVRLTRPGVRAQLTSTEDKIRHDLRELAFMQLARTHYGHKQNRFAMHYYRQLERGGRQWLDSLFEASWASYRIGEYEQALGNLITLSSPFFRDDYFPEALILKAVIYYENCRYRESNLIVQDFQRIYEPVEQQLQVLLDKQMEASEYYNVLHEVQTKNSEGLARGNTDVILERILNLALTDKDLKSSNDSILELEGELDGYRERSDTFRFSGLAKRLMEELKEQRTVLIQKAGIMAKGKLEVEQANLRNLIANGLRIKFETTTKEKEFLEEQLRAGGRTEIVKQYRYSVAVPDDQLYWPYVGEFWRDELGTYQYTLTKGCVDRDSANRNITAGR